jgi:nitric oxide reductase NorQ protein
MTIEIPYYAASGNEIELFEYAWRNRLPVLIKGPTGVGKTRFVAHMAARLGLPLFTVACHDDLTAADLVGRHLIGDGATYWSDGPLTRAVREGGICYLDEVVEARKDTTVVIHPLADHRRVLPIDRTGELLHAPDAFMLVVSYNPGYQNFMKGLKPSTRQRFVCLRFDFPGAAREEAVLIGETGCDEMTAKRLVSIGQALRALKDVDLEEVASTRLLVYAAILIRAGMEPTEALPRLAGGKPYRRCRGCPGTDGSRSRHLRRMNSPAHLPAGRRLAIVAESLYLANLLLAPGIAFAIIAWLWLTRRSEAPALARRHLDQALFVSLWGGILLVACCGIFVLLGGLAWKWTWVLVILYFTCVHSALVTFGIIGLAKAMAGREYVYPWIGPRGD